MMKTLLRRIGQVARDISTCLVWLILLSSIFTRPREAHAATVPYFTAKIFDMKDHSKQMFDYKSESETNGSLKVYTNTITDMAGGVLVIEKTVMSLSGENETLVSFEQDQKQISTVGKLEVRDGKVFFHFTKDGKAKSDDEKAGPDFIVTSTLLKYVQNNWAGIQKGETVKARLGVLDRMETVGFQFTKESENGQDVASGVIVKMKPSSVIIAAMVNPLRFNFSADGKRLFSLEGRTSVKLKVDGKLKDFDGYTVYSWPTSPEKSPEKSAEKPASSALGH